MANICDNELRVYTESPENITAITRFFNEKFPHCSIDDVRDDSMIIYFESKWDFPKSAMEDLIKSIPDKENISMDCLSVEWGNLYCAFHSFEVNKWVIA